MTIHVIVSVIVSNTRLPVTNKLVINSMSSHQTRNNNVVAHRISEENVVKWWRLESTSLILSDSNTSFGLRYSQ